ncbi:MAG: YfaZ family outer membrane protein [Gammaproteobacteria bacterium]|nr:YfaZ family outer membrane protein [Gammaproteobacteria bacterium]
MASDYLRTGFEMMMKRTILSVLILLAASSTAWGRSVAIDMHNEALGINYVNSESMLIKGMGVEAGLLMRESQKPLIHLGLSVAGKNLSKQGTIDISLGGRLYNYRGDNGSLTAIALGGKVRFSPMTRVGLNAHLYFSPDITTFGDANGLNEFVVSADYQVIPQAFAYIGSRHVTVKYPGVTSTLDKKLFVGMKLLF